MAGAGLLVVGCGGTTVIPVPGGPVPPPPTGYTGVAFTGVVMGGSSPVAGASVELYSAGVSGAGSAPTALLAAALTTDASGAFAVRAGYSCASASTELYLVARGGNIAAGQSSNAALALLATVGPCGSVAATRLTVNEVSTAASVWALTQFLGPGGAVGAAATNANGLRNAFATSSNLVQIATGAAPAAGSPVNRAPLAAKINLLANLLHVCAAGASAPGCGSLLSLVTPAGASAPADTLDAARDLALSPGTNVAALYTLAAGGSGPGAAPADWTLRAVYGGGGMHSPSALGVDSGGTVWVANYVGVLSAFSPTGMPVFASGITGSGLNHSYGLAIDSADAVWVTSEDSDGSVNGGFGTVAKFSNLGQPLSGATGFSAGGLNFPVGMAIDANGTVWVTDYGNSRVTLLDLTGKPLSGATGYAVRGGAFPVAVTLDAAHNGWVGDQNDATVTRVSADGQQVANYACCDASVGLAIDQSGGVWVANFQGSSVSRIVDGQATVLTGGGLNHPQGVAIDGAGRVWTASFDAPALTELAGEKDAQPGAVLSPAAGWGADGAVAGAFALAIDASGNIWVTGFNDNTLTETIGIAAPVRTPLLGPSQAP